MAQRNAVVPASKNIWGFDPRTIDGCVLWLDAADANTFFSNTAGTTPASLGGTVAYWKDKSIIGNNATQSTSAKRPTYSALNTLTFTASSSQYLSLASPSSLPIGANNATYFTVSAVSRSITNGVGSIFCHGTASDSLARGINDYIYSTTSLYTQIIFTMGITTSGPIPVYNTSNPYALHITSAQLNNYTVSGWFNGNDCSSNSSDIQTTPVIINTGSTAAYVGGALLGGGSVSYTGNICEILVFNSALSNSDRQTIEGYLAWKWGLQQTLPSYHPYYFNNVISSTFIPTDIPSCNLWFDGSDTNTITGSGTSSFSWTDKTQKNVTSLNSTGYPTLITNAVNNLSAVYVASNTQGIQLNTSGTANTFNYSSSGQISFFAVVYSLNTGADIADINGYGIFSTYWNSSNISFSENGTSSSNISNATLIGPPFLVEITSTGTSGTGTLYVNGTSQGTITTGSTTYTALQPVLSRDGSAGPTYFCELVGFSNLLTTSQRQQIEGYLAWKWGLQSSLPSTHPYYSTNYVFPSTITKPFSRNFVPTDFDGCQVWLDAADTSSVVLTSSNVTQWNDKSGNGNNFTNGSSSLTYASKLNGNNVITGPTSVSQNTLYGPSSLTRNGVNHSYFYVITYPASGASNIRAIFFNSAEFFGHSGSTGPYLENNNNIPNGSTQYWFYTTGAPFASANAFYGGNSFICACVRQNGVYTITSTGNTASTNTNANGTGNASLLPNTTNGQYSVVWNTIGANIAEVIIYNTALSVTQRQIVEGYLAWKWGFRNGQASSPSSYGFPSNHPYYLFPPPSPTPTIPSNVLYKPSFSLQDLQPVIWIDPQDSSTYTLDSNNRVLSIANKGNGGSQNFNITGVSSNVLTVSSTTYLSAGQSFIPTGSGITGLTQGTTYYVLTVPSSTTITVSTALSGSQLTGLTYVSNVYCINYPTFTIPLAGTGGGIQGPLLTQSVVGNGYGQQYMDFSNGGNFLINYGSISGTTLTLNTAIPHSISIGGQITLNLLNATYNGGSSATTALGPFVVNTGSVSVSGGTLTLTLTTNLTHGISAGGNVTVNVNAGYYSDNSTSLTNLSGLTYTVTSGSGGSLTLTTTTPASYTTGNIIPIDMTVQNNAGIVGPYLIPSNLTPTVSSTSGNNITLSSGTGIAVNQYISFGSSFGSIVSGTTYYVLSVSGAVITVGTSIGGTAVSAGSSGSGTTSIGTGGQAIMLTTYSNLTSGTMTINAGRVEYGILAITSAQITGSTTAVLNTLSPHGLTSGSGNLGIDFLRAYQPTTAFQFGGYMSGTSAVVSGNTTLTITLNPNVAATFSSGQNVALYVDKTLSTSTTYSDNSSATALYSTGYVAQAGTSGNTIVLTIPSAPNGSLIFNGFPGVIINTTASSQINGTCAITSTTTHSITITVPSQTYNGWIVLNQSANSTGIPAFGFAAPNLCYYPNVGYAIENASMGSVLTTPQMTMIFVGQVNTPLLYAGAIQRQYSNTPVGCICTSKTVNGYGGTDTTSGGRDYAIMTGFVGGASRIYLKQNNSQGNSISVDTHSDTDFTIYTAVINSLSAVSDVYSNIVGYAKYGWRYSSQFNYPNIYQRGDLTANTTLSPVQLRIGATTDATSTYSTYPLCQYWYEAGLGDIMIFNSVLTMEQRQYVEGYLAQKYACQNYLGSSSISSNTSATYTITSGSVSGSGPYTITLGFSTSTAFTNGSFVVISGATPSGLNNTWYLTASSTTSISFSSATSYTWSSGGTIQGYTTNNATFIHPYALAPTTINSTSSLDVAANYYTQGLVCWFDASNTSTLTPQGGSQGINVTNGSYITSWASISGSLSAVLSNTASSTPWWIPQYNTDSAGRYSLQFVRTSYSITTVSVNGSNQILITSASIVPVTDQGIYFTSNVSPLTANTQYYITSVSLVSGNNYNVTVSTSIGGSTSTVNSNGSLVVSGFIAKCNTLKSTSSYTTYPQLSSMSTNNEFTAFLVFSRDGTTVPSGTIVQYVTGGNTRICLQDNKQCDYNLGGGIIDQAITYNSSTLTSNIPYVLVFYRIGNTNYTRLIGNGTTVTTTSSYTNLQLGTSSMSIVLGSYTQNVYQGSGPFGGRIYEHMMYRYALTIQTIMKLEGYLAWKWGIQTSLPTTHPYYKVMP